MKWVPLKHLVRINARSLPETTDEDFELCYIDIGAVGRGVLLEEPQRLTFAHAPSRARRRVRVGDTLISTVRTYLRAVLPVRETVSELIASTGFAVLTPGSHLDARYLGWLAQSDVVVEKIVSRSVGVSYPAISPLEIGELRVPLHSSCSQQVIANFLDTETARIDALLAGKRRLAKLLGERRRGRVEMAILDLAAAWGEVPLKFVVDDVTVGIVVTPAAWYTPSGIPALRGVNVEPGQINLDELVHITSEGHALHRKSALRGGDVMVVRTGRAGAAAVVPPNLVGANCIDVILIRPGKRVFPQFLEYVLNSDWTQERVDEHSVGTVQSHFNVASMKSLPLPRAPLEEQSRVADHLSQQTRQIDETLGLLNRQLAFLQERRQALITAAVTGELDIPGAA